MTTGLNNVQERKITVKRKSWAKNVAFLAAWLIRITDIKTAFEKATHTDIRSEVTKEGKLNCLALVQKFHS